MVLSVQTAQVKLQRSIYLQVTFPPLPANSYIARFPICAAPIPASTLPNSFDYHKNNYPSKFDPYHGLPVQLRPNRNEISRDKLHNVLALFENFK